MLSLPSSIRVLLALGATDIRKSIDGLAAATKHVLGHDPFTVDLFGFCNRRRDRVKMLDWEDSSSSVEERGGIPEREETPRALRTT